MSPEPEMPSINEILTSDIASLYTSLGTEENGLTEELVNERQAIYGPNTLTGTKKTLVPIAFLSHFKSPVVILLLFAAIVSGFLGDPVDATIIMVIVFISATLDFYQEYNSGKAVELLKKKISTKVTVIRSGVSTSVSLSDLVPGDVIKLTAGDMIPADCRLISSKDLFINQSAITGESFPVEKSAMPLKDGSLAASDWNNFLFMGSSVVSGTARALVVRTGGQTEYGQITQKLKQRDTQTEFDRGLRRFSILIIQMTFILVVFVFFVNTLNNKNLFKSLLFSVALAVGLTPDLLPVIISINLSKGALTMAKEGVIVKKLSSIQNFGSMDVLCTDKTGTLTMNQVSLVKHIDYKGDEDDLVLQLSYVSSSFETGLSSPLNEAILKHEKLDIAKFTKIDEIPFDFNRKRVSIVSESQGIRRLTCKGAPEEVFSVCSMVQKNGETVALEGEISEEIQQLYTSLSSEGYRVLAVAYKQVENTRDNYSKTDERDMIFLGYIAFIDPPKPTAGEAVRSLNSMGVKVKIVTGDNELVTKNICNQIGFTITGIITGADIAGMNDDSLARSVTQANVFVRVSPAQKSRIIQALRNNNQVVGFMGDGINDAPSMKISDVGISVDNAVDVAKETADIILVESNLNFLRKGIMVGRKTFGNTLKYILMGVSSNFGNMFSMAGASVFLPFFPMLPTQILLNNLLSDISQTSIPSDNVDEEYVRKPKKWNISYIRNFMLVFGPISSVFDFVTFYFLLNVFHVTPSVFQTSWFLESLLTQTLIIFSIRTVKVPFFKSYPSRLLILTTTLVLIFAFVLPYTPFALFFNFEQPPTNIYYLFVLIVAMYFVLVELVKKWFFTKFTYLTEKS